MNPWQTDHEYDTRTIVSLQEGEKYWDAKFDDGWSLGIPKTDVIPKVGDSVRRYGKGGLIRGIVLNDKDVVYYRTVAEEKTFREEEHRKHQDEKKRKYEEFVKAKLDEAYESFPNVFKQRIDRFRNANSNFRWEYEPYEMTVCVDAVFLADLFKIPEAVWDSGRSWREGMLSDSGNQVECAYYLAYWYLKDPSAIPQIVGALSPLMGTTDYSEKVKQ